MTLFQLGLMACMARLLTPADFGLIAIATVSLKFLSHFSQAGVASAVIQKSELDDEDVAAALFVTLAVSVAISALGIALSPVFANFYSIAGLSAVLPILALNLVLTALAAFQFALLRRSGRFKEVAVVEISSYILGYGVAGLAAALAGAKYWSLVIAISTQNLTALVLGYGYTRHGFRVKHSRQKRLHFMRFGGTYSVVGFLEFLAANVDSMLIAKVFGPAAAGDYSRAVLLSNLPVQQPANVLTRALFPVLSGISQRRKQALGFQAALLLVGTFAASASAGVALSAPYLVEVLLGPSWGGVVLPLTILSLSVPPMFISHVCNTTIDAIGALRLRLKIQLFSLVLVIFLLSLLAPRFGIAGAALAVVGNEAIRLCILLAVARGMLGLNLRELSSSLFVCSIFGCGTGGAVWLANMSLAPDLPAILRLLALISAGSFGVVISAGISILLVRRASWICEVVNVLPPRYKHFAKVLS